MITRVTGQTQMRAAQRNLQDNMAQLSKLQEQASTLKAINRSSDDPTAAASALAVRAEQAATGQYSRNANDGDNWLTTIDSAMSATSDIMIRVRDLTVQGTNGAINATAKEAIAVELEGLKAELLTQANTTYVGRSVFAGNSDAKAAFVADPDTGILSYTGVSGSGVPNSPVERRISADTTVRVDGDGAAIFGGSAGESVFDLLDDVIASLRGTSTTGATVSSHLTNIDTRMGKMTSEWATIGARQVQVERAQENLLSKTGALETQRVGLEDVDLTQIVLELQLQQVSYQSALAVTAKVLQPTLMDFLR
ncbi:flagellar hook-associated protein FlgL [Cryobacterium sp. TMS1-13-1]|uniref:flagellar hook-associated protein FlgL n=1 Tax=Cryobacterium sp. TMS1-13-1 TaxID=1259220 RepID=UPI00106DC016|nr:flagellar hook-associated protein FlgL [Cryobacterium sp. TMS1-13-1]TFD21758.1 flagellar hook-associated protein 3 [Cryobacterium sp. TMS1-13-1]